MERLESLATHDPPEHSILKGYIAEDATTPNDEVSVLIPSYDMSKRFGPVTFMPRPLSDGSGVLLPTRYDPCLVGIDEEGEARLITWWAEDPT